MAWLAVDEDGTEVIYKREPVRNELKRWAEYPYVTLPSGSIAKLIGRELTWEDEPVMIK